MQAKRRDFYTHISSTIMLELIGAKNYDQLEDMRNIDLYVQNAIEKLKLKW